VYRGYGPSVAGIIVYRAGYFGLYDFSKVFYPREQRFLMIEVPLYMSSSSPASKADSGSPRSLIRNCHPP